MHLQYLGSVRSAVLVCIHLIKMVHFSIYNVTLVNSGGQSLCHVPVAWFCWECRRAQRRPQGLKENKGGREEINKSRWSCLGEES